MASLDPRLFRRWGAGGIGSATLSGLVVDANENQGSPNPGLVVGSPSGFRGDVNVAAVGFSDRRAATVFQKRSRGLQYRQARRACVSQPRVSGPWVLEDTGLNNSVGVMSVFSVRRPMTEHNPDGETE